MLARRIQLVDRPIITAGLLSRWFYGPVDGSDWIGGRTLTLQNTPTWADGNQSTALVLNGTNQYASAASVNFGLNTATEVSISLQIKTTDTTGRIIQKQIQNSLSSFSVIVLDRKIYWSVQTATANPPEFLEYPDWRTVDSINDGEWHRIVCTFKKNNIDATDGIIYKDGTVSPATHSSNSYSATFSISETPENLLVGVRPVTISDFLAGSIADLRVYNRQLSADEAIAITRGQG